MFLKLNYVNEFFLTLDITTELSGAEDPIFLYPIVLNWSVKGAVKEGRLPCHTYVACSPYC